MEEKETKMQEKVIEQVEDAINQIIDNGLQPDNLDNLGKLVDIHKDISNEEYWKVKEEKYMRYRGYDEYGDDTYGRRGVKGTGPYSRYRDGGSYGRRGVPGSGRGRYRGHEMIDEMHEHYGNYAEGRQYGAKDETMESLEDMMAAAYELVCTISEEANSPEEIKIVKKYAKKMSEL